MSWRTRIAQGVLALVGALAVLVATRREPVLSADSLTYLSAADSLHGFGRYVDFTGEPLAHFPPLFPLLLAPGGRSLDWAAVVGAVGAAAAAALFFAVLAGRVRPAFAVAGTVLYAGSQAVITIESTVWSETPYCVLVLATFAVLARAEPAVGGCVAAGAVSGLGFLTRYAGAGLVVSGLAMVVVATAMHDRRDRVRCTAGYLGAAGVPACAWMVRNLVTTGRPLGPHFEGGAGDSLPSLGRQLATAIGQLVVDIDATGAPTRFVGTVAVVALLGAAAATFVRRPLRPVDVGMAVFALTSIVLPVASRIVAGTHVESRIMSPTLIPLVYFAVVGAHSVGRRRLVAVTGWVAVAIVVIQGLVAVVRFPDRVDGSAADVQQFSPELYALVDGLPADATVLTNNPWRVWWHTGRVPTLFAFTVPTPGNSHFPLSPTETVRAACSDDTYLAWFSGLRNADGAAPGDVRPDLAARVELRPVEDVAGGTLFSVTARPDDCAGLPTS